MAIKNIPYRLPGLCAYLFIGAFLACLIVGALIPIYSDEAITKWPYTGILMHYAKVFSFYPQCNLAASKDLPVIFYPAAVALSAAYTLHGPIGLRLGGILIGMLFFYALWSLVHTRFGNGKFSLYVFVATLSTLALGVTPYLLILARSEQIISLTITTLCVICLKRNSEKHSTLSIVGMFFCISLCLLSHPKAIFWMPLFLCASFIITRKRSKLHRFLLISAAISLGYFSYQNALFKSQCEASPHANAGLKSNTLAVDKLATAPITVLQDGLQSMYDAPQNILQHVVFQTSYQSGWLSPQAELSSQTTVINSIVGYVLLALLVGTHLLVLGQFLLRLKNGQLTEWNWLGMLTAVGSVSTAFFMKTWNFYSGSLYLPLSAILLVFCIRPERKRATLTLTLLMFAAITLSSFSLWTLVTTQAPSLLKGTNFLEPAIPGQELSIPAFSAPQHLRSVRMLADMCHLPEGATNLVVDHMTYYAFTDLITPIHALYISEQIYGADLANGRLLPFLRKIESPGLIARCEYVPPQLRSYIEHKAMGYCCFRIAE